MNRAAKDGKTEINIYSKGQTDLGRWLSNFTEVPGRTIDTPHGEFRTVEGYWHWLGRHDDTLRTMSGPDAKSHAGLHPIIHWVDQQQFKRLITEAIERKIEEWQELYDAFIQSELPFVHYYIFNRREVAAGNQWLIVEIEKLRISMKKRRDTATGGCSIRPPQ